MLISISRGWVACMCVKLLTVVCVRVNQMEHWIHRAVDGEHFVPKAIQQISHAFSTHTWCMNSTCYTYTLLPTYIYIYTDTWCTEWPKAKCSFKFFNRTGRYIVHTVGKRTEKPHFKNLWVRNNKQAALVYPLKIHISSLIRHIGLKKLLSIYEWVLLSMKSK